MKQEAIICLNKLAKSYGEKDALQGISLDIYPGQVIGYIGTNGAGKSTTIKILSGLISDFNGDASICGFDVRQSPLEVKKRIGYVPETAVLFDSLTPMEYLRFVGRMYYVEDDVIEQRATQMLTILGLKNELTKPITTFSKGMRQRVLICASVIHNPEVLFLDEPLSGLDANSVVLVKELIIQLAKAGKTILYCSHMMDVVEKVCDRIVILSQGEIIADGTFEQLSDNSADQSLEAIFTQLTSQVDHHQVAKNFVGIFNKQTESC